MTGTNGYDERTVRKKRVWEDTDMDKQQEGQGRSGQ